ncbi:MAG TPA: nickel pincer cofactor biosynthesis protein LarC [Candidatus Bipolaricaulis anaerobius]|nr:nickel pincer cofactor biosynthesis protein LarC [Candidatus Bipolaricaulis anaerobius]
MIVLEPFCGVSGDMLLGVLCDLGGSPEILGRFEAFRSADVRSVRLSVERVLRRGIGATAVRVEVEEEEKERSWEELTTLLHEGARGVGASPAAVGRALKALEILGDAEARVHGHPREEVHFHETGSFDTVVDVLGFFLLLESLGNPALRSLPVRLGRGSVRCAHGLYPVPPPAVAEIAARCHIPVEGGPVEGELATPTGMALLASAATFSPSLPSLIPRRIGYGAGQRDLAVPNVLRGVWADDGEDEAVWVVEASLDDATGEEMGRALERLQEVSLEAHLLSGVGKKGRPLFVLRVVAREEELSRVRDRLLEETPTLGVRSWPVARTRMAREVRPLEVTVDGEPLPVRVKISRLGDVEKRKVEADDVARLRSLEMGLRPRGVSHG